MHINNEKKNIDKDDTIYIPLNAAQFIENTGEENLEEYMGSNLDRLTENAGILPLGIYKQIKASEISLVI